MKTHRKTGIRKGFARPCVLWFTGLSGSGKSTIADRVASRLSRMGIEIEQLDGDQVRQMFPGTGFSRDQREEHLRRIGYLAALLEKHGVTVIASFVSPYKKSRHFIRKLCKRFIEVYISTPLKECERRDVKGLYKKARKGQIKNFTGISDPYEAPRHSEITIDTTCITVNEATRIVINYLLRH
ncbi:MAG: adenylyl-sulfate kinase [Kiritimatiellae bacterium]|nr:adenylyl-sulfate kinase [Kiritimatiellia bacterium]MDD5522705.1 adenylyl-sulfate kinase [Kiritimatiellia bacterium]